MKMATYKVAVLFADRHLTREGLERILYKHYSYSRLIGWLTNPRAIVGDGTGSVISVANSYHWWSLSIWRNDFNLMSIRTSSRDQYLLGRVFVRRVLT